MALEAQENPFPYVTIEEVAADGSETTPNPAADFRKLFLGEDGLLYTKDSAGTVASAAASGSITTDTAWAAKGDLIAATANNAASVLTVGSNDTILMADSGQSTGLKWVASQTPSTQAFGDAAAQGTADTYARGDHKHAMPSAPAGALLGVTRYSKGADSVWATTSSGTDADIDATNGILAITVPASGAFLAMISLDWTFGTANTGGYITLRQGSTQLGSAACISGNIASAGIGGGTVSAGHFVGWYYVTGQTPGAMTLKAGFLRIGSTVLNVYAHDATGAAGHLASPFILTAWAA